MGGLFSKSYYHTDPVTFATQITDTESDDTSNCKEYDYIVVGGGSAGCVVASRLSEDPSVSVLLIESGKSKGNLFTQIPLAFTKVFGSEVDWSFTTTPQKAQGGKQPYWARGRILGGTSVLNACIYHRCSPEDFDGWAKGGATGWSYDDLEPYFKKAERFLPNKVPESVNIEHKGQSGPWVIGQDGDDSGTAPIIPKIIAACQNVGMDYHEDLNKGGRTLGVVRLPGTVDEKGRSAYPSSYRVWFCHTQIFSAETGSSTATAYLTNEVLARPNLTVACSITVERILFDREPSLRAAGVQLTTAPAAPKFRVRAKREIILSGGVIGSAQTLLLSGIGPKDELEQVGVNCVQDLPSVGKHLADHISGGPFIFRAKPGYTLDYLNNRLAGAPAILQWLLWGTGPFGKMPLGSAAFMRTDDPVLFDQTHETVKDLSSGPNSPDLEFMWTPAIVPDFFSSGKPGEHGITFSSVALKPESEGSIVLRSNSVWEKPLIDGNYFASENDVNVVLRGVRLLFKLARTEPLASVLDLRPQSADKDSYFWPGDLEMDKFTDDQLRDWIRANGAPAAHPVGTCRIGQSSSNSVVDPSLKVHGVGGLRIVDASVFPTQISGHPIATIVAMAEKLADLVKDSRNSAPVV
ncbi:hypothetical protein NLI96_g3899 [Meripilus lineatus]|uniref:GMC oxidoreductase n=1 Tax=Meripilus lineatus TaxID=2056292 RepID=A0AAD5YII8_9APHY|nr:hypothetical protein NLI96_g3899 [Physisporinus lineatus]